MTNLNTCFSPFMMQDLMRKLAKIENHSSNILLLLILSTFLSYMTSNKNSIDSLNEMLLLCTSLIGVIHWLFLQFHQCIIIKGTCHYFMLSVLIAIMEFLYTFNYQNATACYLNKHFIKASLKLHNTSHKISMFTLYIPNEN